MSDKASAQQDLLKELYNYSATIIPGTETLIAELRHNRQSDTDELFNLVIQGINWEIEVFNNCEDLINRDEQRIDKGRMASAVGRLGKVLQERMISSLQRLWRWTFTVLKGDETCCRDDECVKKCKI